jgi:hypothetical protein
MLFFPKVRIRWSKVIAASLIVFIIDMVIRQIEVLLTMKYYLMPEYFGVWSKLMMPKAGPPPPEFFVTSTLFSFLGALILACVYECIKTSLLKQFWPRVLGFTKLMTLLMLAFSYLPMFLLINLPQALIGTWLVTSILMTLIASIVFVKILK